MDNDTIRKKCKGCDADILDATYSKTGGYCISCTKKNAPWYKVSKYIEGFAGVTSGIFGLIIGFVLGYSLFGFIGAIVCGIFGFLVCFG